MFYSDMGETEIMKKISDIVPPKHLGAILGAGVTTIAIDCYQEYFFAEDKDNEIMVITIDPLKSEFYERVFGETLDIEELVYEETDEYEEYKSVLMELLDNGLHIFYMPKLRMATEDLGFSLVTDVCEKMEQAYGTREFITGEAKFKKIKKLSFCEAGEKLKEATVKSIKAHNEIYAGVGYGCQLDLHEGQFVDYHGEFFCIDPLYVW